MELKDYQQQTLDTLDRYLEGLKAARQQADKASVYLASDDVPDFLIEQAANLVTQAADYPRVAWESLRKASVLLRAIATRPINRRSFKRWKQPIETLHHTAQWTSPHPITKQCPSVCCLRTHGAKQ